MAFAIEAITYVLGEKAIDIAKDFPSFIPVISKTGIRTVHESEGSALDLAEKSLKQLLGLDPALHRSVGALIVVTQSPENLLPSAACSLQYRCELADTVFAFDIGQGCSGFVQALVLGEKLLETHENVIIVCTDTYRQKLRRSDRSTMAVFSDAASAVWLTRRPVWNITAQSHFSNGGGGNLLMQKVPKGLNPEYLQMSGADVFLFTKNVVPIVVSRALAQGKLAVSEVQNWFFHQASKLVLDHLKSAIGIEMDIHTNLETIGNTVSSSIPILMSGSLDSLADVMCLCGFGVGLSCSTAIVTRE